MVDRGMTFVWSARSHISWRTLRMMFAAVVLVFSTTACGAKGLATATVPVDCSVPTPAMSDEFDGPAGAPPNPELWNYQMGAGGADGKLQAYTDYPRNVSLNGEGSLAMTAINEPIPVPNYGTFDYSSARINTLGHLDICYGSLSAQIKFPTGQGLKPAFWLLGSDFDAVGWPAAGEIDIFEQVNSGDVAGSALHGTGIELSVQAPSNTGDQWHVYSLDWRRDQITTSIDGQVLGSWTPASLPPGTSWVFNDRPFFVVLNLAVGGLAGPPDASTPFPATMLVDWMRYTP